LTEAPKSDIREAQHMNKRRNDLYPALLFLAPNLLGFLVFTAGPVVFSLIMSMTNWNLMRTVPFHWTFFENYVQLFRDQQFWLYFINTAYLMLGLPVAIAGSLLLALMLNQRVRGITVYRTLFYLPSFTAGVFIETLHITSVSAPQWLLSVKNLLGLNVETVGISPSNFGLGARDAIIIMGIWTAIGGNNMLLYIAALTNLPQELVEAAQIDGAGKWQVFKAVTWPYLAPTTFFIVIMSFIGGLQGGFEQARVMTNGGPAGTTTTMSYYIYTKAFEEFQMGYASAVSWVLFAIIFAVTLVNWKFGNRGVE
jgi:multiple sugar transport system permease protein